MIRLHVSAVLCVSDGFTGHPIAPSTVSCLLDGAPYRPQYREGGYLVFVNLAPGLHALELRGAYYQPERMALEIRENEKREYGVTLKPASNYPFGSAATRLLLYAGGKGKPAVNRAVWIAVRAAGEDMKLAQDQAEAGSASARVFQRGATAWISRNFLIADGKNSEIVLVSDLQEGQALFAEPLVFPHKRGAPFYPAQAFLTDGRGECTAFFREPMPVEVFDPQRGRLVSAELAAGDNRLELGV